MSTAAISSTAAGSNAPAGATASTKNELNAQDRFLKMLVAQMQNQDPLNPLDNAQVTSQMAQINTVTGIEKLNGSINAMLLQLTQAQALQGASLVGRDVLVPGDTMRLNDKGEGRAGFDLASKADKVTVEVLDQSGAVLDRFELGALDAGRHYLGWKAEDADEAGDEVRLRITAKAGASAVAATTYARDTVGAVSTSRGSLELDLAGGGTVAYNQVKAVI
ncbi:flagellar hook assembly protein FlgD [Schlegelella aquatica]|uniref:flagellar hook assembly protein FlgD n=1 Tax=Caldimonas aquatica TaxID=376175 RepID=UPI00375347C5